MLGALFLGLMVSTLLLYFYWQKKENIRIAKERFKAKLKGKFYNGY